jgi:DNA-binding MarR family transcriptional regulator
MSEPNTKKPNTKNFELLVDRFMQITERLRSQMERSAARLKERTGLSPHQVHILNLLSLRNEMRSTEMARAIGLTPGAITSLTNELVEKNLITRTRIEQDRRVVLLRLTDQGHETIKNLLASRKKQIRKTLELLGYEDAERFLDLLETISSPDFFEQLDRSEHLDESRINRESAEFTGGQS